MGKRRDRDAKQGRQDDTQVRINFLFQASHVVPLCNLGISRSILQTMRNTSTRSVSSVLVLTID